MNFWERVKQKIKIQNTTQEWVAKCVEVSIGTFRNWIYYDRIPQADQSVKIAQALDTSVEYLVNGKENLYPSSNNPDYNELCELLSGLSEKQLAEVKGVLKSYIQSNFQERDSGKRNRA